MDEYGIKAQSMKQRQHEIAVMMGNHEKGDDKFKTTVEALFSLASKAYENFESSKIEQKRQLMAFVFSNLALKGAKQDIPCEHPSS